MRRLVAFLPLIFLGLGAAAAEDPNYCHDKASWAEWDALVAKYPEDQAVQALHALRIGLCVKVDRGSLSLQEATEIFEGAREAIVHGRREESAEREREGRDEEPL